MKKGLGTANLILLVIVLVMGIVFFGKKMMSSDASLSEIMGGTSSSTCTGTVSLSLSSNSATIASTVSGLSGCNGKTVYIKQNSCSSNTECNCTVSGSGCSCSFIAPSSAGAYTYYACVDKNADDNFSDPGESVAKSLTIS